MEAFVYLRARAGTVPRIVAELATTGVRRAVIVVGDWDILALAEGPDLATIATNVLSNIHSIDGVERTQTAPVVPSDRLGDLGAGFAMVRPPTLPSGDACYVHVRAVPGTVPGIVESVAEMDDVSGVAALAGEWDVLIELPLPWEIASGIVLEKIHALTGVVATKTMVSVAYEEPEEDRDQFSAWS